MRSNEETRVAEFLVLIKPVSLGFQILGLMFFILAWGLADASYRYEAWHVLLIIGLAAASMAGSWFTRFLSNFSILTVWIEAAGFVILAQPTVDRVFWETCLGIIISLVIAPVYSRLREYILVACGVWLIFGGGALLQAPHGGDTLWAAILMPSVIALGMLLNTIFSRIHLESVTLRKELERLAYKDALTGIDNRRRLLEEIQRLHACGGLTDACFLMIDVDDFKRINDEFGHAQGDQVLQAVADAIQRMAEDGAVGRLGGEEFGVLLASGGEARAARVARRILDEVRRLEVGGRPVTASIGAAAAGGSRPVSEMLREADVAMYDAKRQGKDRLVFRHGSSCQ